MIPYIIMLFSWGVITFLMQKAFSKKIRPSVYIVLPIITLFVLMAFRDISVGTDLRAYLREFNNALSNYNTNFRNTEKGFVWFNYFLKYIGINFQFYLAIISILFLVPLSILYSKFSKNILLSYYLHVTIGLFAMSLSGLRQIIATLLTMIAFIFLYKNKKLFFIFIVLLAYTFHNSSIIFILAIFIYKIALNRSQAIFIYVISLSTYFFRSEIASLLNYINIIEVNKHYESYLDVLKVSVNPLVIIVAMAIPFASLFFWPKIKDRSLSIFFVFSCVNFIIYFLALEVPMISRLSYYFLIYITILIPNIVEEVKDRDMKLIAKFLVVILPFIQFILVTPNGSLGIDNYKFFFSF